MNYYFLYYEDTGELYKNAYHGDVDGEWSNFPVEGLSYIGPIQDDDADELIMDAASNPSKYVVIDGKIENKPFLQISVYYENDTYNISSATNTGEEVDILFDIMGMTFEKKTSEILALNVHKVLANKHIDIAVSSGDYLGAKYSIGGNDKDLSTAKITQDETGKVFIKPISKKEITNYYMLHTVPQSDIMTDLANWVDMLTSLVIKMADSNASFFNEQENLAIQDIKTNLLPKLRLELADATINSANPRYAQIVNQKEQANMNADEFLALISDPDVK